MTPLHVGTSYTHNFGFYSKGNASATHQSAWAGSLKPLIAWAVNPQLTGGHPPLKFPPYSLIRPKGGRKTINFFTYFHGFVPDTNYKHLECFVMLGTLSEPRRGQMSHICDISALRVKMLVSTFVCIYIIITIYILFVINICMQIKLQDIFLLSALDKTETLSFEAHIV